MYVPEVTFENRTDKPIVLVWKEGWQWGYIWMLPGERLVSFEVPHEFKIMTGTRYLEFYADDEPDNFVRITQDGEEYGEES